MDEKNPATRDAIGAMSGPRPPSEYAVELAVIKKSYGPHDVLKGVSLRVKEGEVCSIIGPSGAGKSTLLRCANLLEQPDSGQIAFADQFIDAGRVPRRRDLVKLRRNVGMVFQSFNLFPHMTVLDNVMLPQKRVLGRDADTARVAALELLERVGLGEKTDSYPAKISGGQQQRVAIARALALEPKVMLFDEPTSALDPELAKGVLDVMKEVAESGMTMLVVTHEMGFARNIGNHLVVMEDGNIIEEGDPEQVMTNPSQERTRRFLSAVIDR